MIPKVCCDPTSPASRPDPVSPSLADGLFVALTIPGVAGSSLNWSSLEMSGQHFTEFLMRT